jgi:cell division protein ZipA
MAELRWILILLGLLLIAAVYLLGRRRPRPPVRRLEPRLSDDGDGPADPPTRGGDPYQDHSDEGLKEEAMDSRDLREADRAGALAAGETGIGQHGDDTVADEGEKKIISVRVAARSSTRFRGADVVRIMIEEGLEFGRYEIFHRPDDQSDDAVFSVASMVEPGTFDLDAMESEHIPGVTLFLVLPGPRDGNAALDDMLATAQRMAAQLNGEVLDQSGSTLSRQRAGNLRDEIIAFQHHLAIHRRQPAAPKGRRRLL